MAQHEPQHGAQNPDAGISPENAQPLEAQADEAQANAAPEPAGGAAAQAPSPFAGALAGAAREKKRRSGFPLFFTTVVLLGAGAAAAYHFRDKHEMLRAYGVLVDNAVVEAKKLIATIEGKQAVVSLGETPSARPPASSLADETADQKKEAADAPAKAADDGERVTWAAPAPAPAPAPKAETPSARHAETPSAPPPAPSEPTAAPAASATPVPAPAASAEAPAHEDGGALAKRVDQLEQLAQSALKASEEARAAVKSAAPSDETSGAVSALQGRLDELASELRALKEKLDSPKNETRAAQEAGGGGNPAAVLVVTHSLLRALEQGAPFSAEYQALAAQDADAQALAALAPSADKGAPTARQLLAEFGPLAKRIGAAAVPNGEVPYAQRVLQGAARLVKIRPSGAPGAAAVAPLNASDAIGEIEAALERGDVSAALDAFAKLPEPARVEAKNWGEEAARRRDAEKAAASLLSGAVAALGRNKS